MQKMICLIALFFHLHTADAQGTWTWLHGDSVTQFNSSILNGVKATRGMKGVEASTNSPPRTLWYGLNWKDAKDKFWILGSRRPVSSSTILDTFEVWSYNYRTNSWTWEAGYDTMYIDGSLPDSLLVLLRKTMNYLESPYWSDSIGNLWYFHEIQINNTRCTLVIKFDIVSKRFRVIDYRINYSSYGSKGVSSSSNWPQGKGNAMCWTFQHRAFLFAGSNFTSTNTNELWEYNMTTGQWIWHGGGPCPPCYYSYGSKGVASASNWPLASYASKAGWVKGSKLYYVGGLYQESSFGNQLSELWEYDVSTGLWTWLSGVTNASLNHPGVYSSMTCVDSPGLFPASRVQANSVSTRVCNNSMWYYSGTDYTGTSNSFFNDLWLYKPNENRWMWVYGKLGDTTYNYGQKGVSNLVNKPPARTFAMMWSDNQDRLYLFGGREYNVMDYSDPTLPGNYAFGNDMWRYDPDYSCINYSLSEKFIDRNIKYKICQGDSTVVKVRAGYDSLRVIPMGAEVAIHVVASGAEISLKPSATKSYKIIAYGYRCESLLDSLTVSVVVSPPRTSSEAKTICFGASYLGKTMTGTHILKYPDPLKCDSVHTLTLTVRPEIIKIIDSTVCEGSSVFGRSVRHL